MSDNILMHKGIALWLAKKTNLSIYQIADFCNLHEIEVDAFRKGLNIHQLKEFNPINAGLLSEEIIAQCEQDSKKKLKTLVMTIEGKKPRKSRSSAKKHEAPGAILWLLHKYAFLKDEHIAKLLGCTKTLVISIRDKSFKGYESLIPKHPVVLELCSQTELDKALVKHSI